MPEQTVQTPKDCLDLTYEVKQLQFDIGSLSAFSIALVVYFLIAQLLVMVIRWFEKRAAARVGRGAKAVVIEEPQTAGAE